MMNAVSRIIVPPARANPLSSLMDMRDVIVVVDDGERSALRTRLALQTAERFGARVTGVFVAREPEFPLSSDDEAPAEILSLLSERRARTAQAAETAFHDAARHAGVTSGWTVVQGAYRDVLDATIERVRAADLTFVDQATPGFADLPDQLVLNAGRPVIFLPREGGIGEIGNHVMVAWNSSREASRALNDALPLLELADQVSVLTIEQNVAEEARLRPEMRLSSHLARHGIKASIRQSFVKNTNIGAVILARAADAGADLLVTGAYGHSRLHELVLGGVTRHLLENATIPVLMSH